MRLGYARQQFRKMSSSTDSQHMLYQKCLDHKLCDKTNNSTVNSINISKTGHFTSVFDNILVNKSFNSFIPGTYQQTMQVICLFSLLKRTGPCLNNAKVNQTVEYQGICLSRREHKLSFY